MNRIARRAPWTILALLLAVAPGAAAQEPPPADAAAPPAFEEPEFDATAVEPPSEPAADADAAADAAAGDDADWTSSETRSAFVSLLSEHPTELGTILALDPTLLGIEGFLDGYPELAAFVALHPEVRRNPRFYLASFQPMPTYDKLDQLFEMGAIFSIFVLIALALAWLVRTLIEQKRWNRLSRTQSEVHNKILDRFGSTEELLAYVQTPAGARFLESAPIPLRAERPAAAHGSPVGRAMWSIQLGVVIAAAAAGMLLVGAWYDGETARALFALGAIALCTGLGFVGSAAVSIVMSRRLGLWQTGAAAADESGFGG